MGRLEGKELTISNSESERRNGVVVEKRKDILEVWAMHWEGLGKMSQLGQEVPIDNLKFKAKEVNWMIEPLGFQEMFTIVKGLMKGMDPGPDGIINEMLMYGGNRMVEVLHSLVNLVMESRIGQMIEGRVMLCHSLKLGVRR